MRQNKIWDIIIVGGGLAGLTTTLHLSRQNIQVCLIEKNQYPNHKVCGEYVSNEVLPYLKSLNIDPFNVGAKKINKFQITDIKGSQLNSDLPLGGFGISRFAFDNLLYNSLKESCKIFFGNVTNIKFHEDEFELITQKGEKFYSKHVVGAFGKRSNLDNTLDRDFMNNKSPWLAVKGHYEYDFPSDTVALHNFKGGYCGLSKTEENVVNACYLTTYNSFKKHKNIDIFQNQELSRNPYLEKFFKESIPVFEKPLTISQISFNKKAPVENHIFMIGDSAGLIHPLCGNGMAMAIRGAQIFSETYISTFQKGEINRKELEHKYSVLWNKEFSSRLQVGRYIQKALMNPISSQIGFTLAKAFPSLIPKVITKTHGSPIR